MKARALVKPNLTPMKETPPKLPDGSVAPIITDGSYPHVAAINGELWDTYTPYQLAIVVANDNGNEIVYTPTEYRFTLPIPPQELTLEMPVPTNIQATLDGIAMQHGGAPFRLISLQGTTGITPLRHRVDALAQRGVVESILGNNVTRIFDRTAIAAGGVVSGINKVFTGGNVHTGLALDNNDPNKLQASGTGYYQMRMMEQFLESYVAMKVSKQEGIGATRTDGAIGGIDLTDLNPRMLRLAFCMWKDESVYLVEPLAFSKRRSSANPMEYMFTLQLKAWKRVKLNASGDSQNAFSFVGRTPSELTKLLARMAGVRETLEAGSDMLRAAISDPASSLAEVTRETNLFLSDLSGGNPNLSMYPQDIVDAAWESIQKNWTSVREKFLSIVSPGFDLAMRHSQSLGRANSDATLRTEFAKKVAPIMRFGEVPIPAAIQRKAAAERARVLNLGRADFERSRDIVLKAAADFADRIGAGDAAYAAAFGRSAPTMTRTPTDSELDLLYALNEISAVMDHLATSSSVDPKVPTSLEYVAGLAQRSGIAFKIPQSKFAVPFPYGSTLEQLALQYLGDANRWHEIATLNGLRAPYIDEIGFSLPLIANGYGNVIIVSDASNLFQGQTIWLVGNGIRREKRHIVKIVSVQPTQHLLTLDGDADLDRFTVAGAGALETFLPATVNSQQIIYIPSENAAAEDPKTKAVPGVDVFDPLLQISGVDLLLTPDGDLAITPDGDCRLAYGLTNIVQTVRLLLSTPHGSLLQHPEFGLLLPVGESTADIDANDIVDRIKDAFKKDPTFSGVRSVVVQKIGAVLQLTVDVGVAGTSQFVPITVSLS
jgi:hypothetical protein